MSDGAAPTAHAQNVRHRLIGFGLVTTAAIFWATSVVAGRVILRQVDALSLAQASHVVSWLALALGLAIVRPTLLRVQRRDIWRFALLGAIGIAGSSYLVNVGIQRTNTVMGVTLQYAAPAIVLIWNRWRGTEKVDWKKVVAVVASMTGCVFATGLHRGKFVFDALGIAAAGGAAFTFAFVSTFSKSFGSRYNPLAFTAHTFLASSLMYLLFQSHTKLIAAFPNREVVWYMLGYTLVLGLVPIICFFYSLRFISATAVTITCSFEIVIAGTLAWIILGEAMAPSQIAGSLMILAAVILIEQSRADEEASGDAGETISVVPTS
ncbi:MAG: DMT family transporter [Candidatus Sumerlaeaceae bacterium]|nr:DMT family transporter [Candidatus Sumerlaeaceae bacterium]